MPSDRLTFKEMCAAFDGSERVNIGCDETFDVGWGRSKAEAEKRAEEKREKKEE